MPSALFPSNSQPEEPAFVANQQLGRGINLGNALEAPREGSWGVYLQEDYFSTIADAGFDSVRVPIRWSGHAERTPPYSVKESLFERVDWVIEQALQNDLVVIINMHHYNDIYQDPEAHTARFLGIWQQIATRYQDAPDSVYFELLNEPNSILGASKWNRLLADALAIVRESNPVRIVIIGPVHWNQIAQLTSLELPPEDRRIIVTFHYYHPFQFTHQGASWVDGAYDWGGTTWTGTDLEKREIELDMKLALDWATKENRPLYMGEFGAYSVADMESRVRWTQFVRSQAEAHNISWAYWEFASGFGAYDPARDEWREPLLKALIP